ncbi:TIGR01621 family pseudouridine synthase [Vibrio rumoiensis]|uniref:RNA pseudouridine synthase n=1 Tax=Vibrio rumoiensis 1S-45 TaxID=1188252 RepID=A0A1E5E449_9VIBR|nr:TIGR01621 family pseudouridine synthase [Vibrio rumoiensis]OEF27450.1 RNA pseudouridine synthase [Vibrio rumoiensis 1S-45]
MFDILHQNSDFIVINKHPNVSVHKDDGETSLLIELTKALGDTLPCDQKLYLVHRLDKMTSGILLLAKHQQAASDLSQLFAQRMVSKYYLAIGVKKPKKKQGLVCGDMERSRRSSWKLLKSLNNPAKTQFFSAAGQEGQRVFLCKPHTGKTHQIRVALNSIGSSIIGDDIYTPSSQADRGYLHAFALSFSYLSRDFEFICNPTSFPNMGEKWQSDSVKQAIESWSIPGDLPWPSIK